MKLRSWALVGAASAMVMATVVPVLPGMAVGQEGQGAATEVMADAASPVADPSIYARPAHESFERLLAGVR
jgi:hypothetical protein